MSTIFLSLSQQTPMHTAAKVGNKFTMEGLFELGADINIKDNDGVNIYYLCWIDFSFSVLLKIFSNGHMISNAC